MANDNYLGNASFKYPWRPYQQRALDEIKEYLTDQHIHLIAPPGSGKTVLGLEIIRLLGKPTLILSPTITIRDQWIDKFVRQFLQTDKVPAWISQDIRNPGFLTITTYQALYSAHSGIYEAEEVPEEESALAPKKARQMPKVNVAALLHKRGVQTIVVDEAHHLRSEWWKCLTDMTQQIPGATTVALTATPPYDVTPQEWERYKELCGPIDAEISVPELIREKNLCPHQDYVYFASPSIKEKAIIGNFAAKVGSIGAMLTANRQLLEAIKSNPIISQADRNEELILETPDFYSSIAIYLNAADRSPPRALLWVLGTNGRRVPEFDLEWQETFLTGLLFRHSAEFQQAIGPLKEIRSLLASLGCVEHRQVLLRTNDQIKKLLTHSSTKLDSIVKIAEVESAALKSGLRLVILTDFIRKEAVGKSGENELERRKLGVIPIFQAVKAKKMAYVRLGILTGGIVVVPRSVKAGLLKTAGLEGIAASKISFSAFGDDPDYLVVDIHTSGKSAVVRMITQLFAQGEINTLVGTASLLGEGWDAPEINTLILASYVGSYMLSNQMRGRAIRTDPRNPDKTSNIWHLVCADPNLPDAGPDLGTLRRRFEGFVGVSFRKNYIMNGIDRLDIGNPPYIQERIASINQAMIGYALDRPSLPARWAKAIDLNPGGSLREEIMSPKKVLPRSLVFANTIKALLYQGVSWGLFAWQMYMRLLSRLNVPSLEIEGILLLGGFGLAGMVTLPFALKSLFLAIKHRSLESSIGQVGYATLAALCAAKIIKTPFSSFAVKAYQDETGFVKCYLDGGTTYERSVFIDAMHDVLNPIMNPRYILVRSSFLWMILREDYYAVPKVLSLNKENALLFQRQWNMYVGNIRLVYTRTAAGRKTLLRARTHAFSAGFRSRSERTSCWR